MCLFFFPTSRPKGSCYPYQRAVKSEFMYIFQHWFWVSWGGQLMGQRWGGANSQSWWRCIRLLYNHIIAQRSDYIKSITFTIIPQIQGCFPRTKWKQTYRLPQFNSSLVSCSISDPWKVMEKLSILMSRARGWMPKTPVQERASLAMRMSSSSLRQSISAKPKLMLAYSTTLCFN